MCVKYVGGGVGWGGDQVGFALALASAFGIASPSARKVKTRQDKTRQDKTRQDKTRQGVSGCANCNSTLPAKYRVESSYPRIEFFFIFFHFFSFEDEKRSVYAVRCGVGVVRCSVSLP